MNENYWLRSVGYVESELIDPLDAPRQGSEGAPAAWLVFNIEVEEALRDVVVGDDVYVITWLHKANRDVLRVHPRGDLSQPMQGVFSTRSPHRPNPLGLHPVTVFEVDGTRVKVTNLEAINGTPIVDIKPVLRTNELPRA